jgi:hypothetical protein
MKTKRAADRRMTPSERQEEIFVGITPLRQLSVGIAEDLLLGAAEDEDELTAADEIDWFGDDHLEEDEEEIEEAKEKKKNCEKGNPYHDKDGRFVDPNKEGGSWSIANKSSKGGCKRGKARRPSGRQERWRELPCGLVDVDNPNVKAKNKCKGGVVTEGKMLWEQKYQSFVEEQDSIHDEKVDVPTDPYEFAKLQQKNQVIIRSLKKQVLQAKKNNLKNCPLSYNDALLVIRSLELASKGKTINSEK